MADVLRVPMNRARVVQKALGGTLGSKEESAGLVADRCAYLRNLTKRSVKFVFNREGSFLKSAKHHPFHLRYKTGFTKGGWIVVWQGEQVDNYGAYSNQIQFISWRANVHSAGPHEIGSIKTDTYDVLTNNIHSGAMRGYSSPQLIWMQERFIGELAMACGTDELEFRRRDLFHGGALTATDVPVEHCVIQEVMDVTTKQTSYKKKHTTCLKQLKGNHKRRGIGLAVRHRGSGLKAESSNASGCMTIYNEDGSAMTNSDPAEDDQGLKTACAQIAAGTLDANYKAIRFFGTDTHSIPDCDMTMASRGTVMGTQSVRRTGEKSKRVMIQNALELHSFPLEETEKVYGLKKGTLDYSKLTTDQIKLLDNQFYLKKYPDVKVPFSGVCNTCLWTDRQMAAFEQLRSQDLIQDHEAGRGKAFPIFACDCIAAEVEIGMKISYVSVLEVTANHDVRTAINPALTKGQIYGGIVMSQGLAVTEDVVTDRCGQKTRNFDSYILLTSIDAPKTGINIYKNQNPAGTYGAKSTREPATGDVGATIADVIFNATGR